MDNTHRIIFFGTSDFAVPILETLCGAHYSAVAVVTNPDEPVGRKMALTPPPVKVFAEKQGIAVLQPDTLKDFDRTIAEHKPDIFIVAAYGKILPSSMLQLPKHGALNVHPSLLPRWRGPSPIQYAILEGDTETGVTIMCMDDKADHGPILAARRIVLQGKAIAYKELENELSVLGAELLVEILPKWLSGEATAVQQDESRATYSKLLKKDDGRISWISSAAHIERMARAFSFWPGSFTFWHHRENIVRLIIEEAEAISDDKEGALPGFVWQTASRPVLVQTGQGSLEIKRIRPEGKKALSAQEFLNGHKDIIGSTLG